MNKIKPLIPMLAISTLPSAIISLTSCNKQNVQIVSKTEWLEKYKTYSDVFQSSTMEYTSEQVEASGYVIDEGTRKDIDSSKTTFIYSTQNSIRSCQIYTFDSEGTQVIEGDIGGGTIEYSNFVKQIEQFELTRKSEFRIINSSILSCTFSNDKGEKAIYEINSLGYSTYRYLYDEPAPTGDNTFELKFSYKN